MKKILAVALILANPAHAADACQGLADALKYTNKNFPELTGPTRELGTWRAGRCDIPPQGPGDIVDLCESVTVRGTYVVYWSKETTDSVNAGFNECP